MAKKYYTYVKTNDIHKRVLDCITTGEIDKFFKCTDFSGDNKCRQAMIHGMCIAAMLMSDCDQMLVESEEISYESGTI